MTDIVKDLLNIANGQNIRTFNEEGAHVNRKPYAEIEQYAILGVTANREYTWDFATLGHDIIPQTLFGFRSTGVANNDSLIIRIRNASTNTLI